MIVALYFSTIRHQIPPSARIGRLAEFERPSWLAHWGDKPELSVKVPRQVNRIRVSQQRVKRSSGVHASAQLEALRHVRGLDEVRVWSRTPAHAKRFAEERGARATDAESAVQGAD